MNAAAFRDLVLSEFPSLLEDFEEWDGLLHLQVSEFRQFTQNAIEAHSFGVVSRCFQTATTALHEGDEGLRNACASPKLHPAKKLNRSLDILTVKSRLGRPTRASWKAMKIQADGILAGNSKSRCRTCSRMKKTGHRSCSLCNRRRKIMALRRGGCNCGSVARPVCRSDRCFALTGMQGVTGACSSPWVLASGTRNSRTQPCCCRATTNPHCSCPGRRRAWPAF